MATNKRRPLRRYAFLLSLVCCLLIAGVSLAKMLNNDPVEKGGAHVAEWRVDVSSTDSSNMTLDAGSSPQTYSLVVTNSSEIMSTYSIKVSNIPVGVKIGLDITSDSDLVTPIDGQVIFTNTGGDLDYAAPNNTRSHTLTLVAEASANITQSSVNMVVDVLFAQKDPRS